MPAATNTISQNAETIYLEGDARIIAEQCARGDYQHRLVAGLARWSGADLRGKASKYAGHYARSRDSIVHKMRSAGLHVMLVRGTNDKHIAVISCDTVIIAAEGKRNDRTLRLVQAAA